MDSFIKMAAGVVLPYIYIHTSSSLKNKYLGIWNGRKWTISKDGSLIRYHNH